VEVDYLICQRDEALDLNSKSKEVPVVRLFGVNDNGNSVCAFIHGFQPYFYAEKPSTWGNEAIEELHNEMNKRLSERTKGSSGDIVTSITLEKKSSIWGYQKGDHKDFLKITTSLPNHVATARGLVESGLKVGDYGTLMGTTYESNVVFAMRFMVDLGIVGGNWVELPKGTFKVMAEGQCRTFCQIEVHANYQDLISHAPEGEWARMAPLRVLSFDIECAGRKGHFPEAKLDPVIQIASMVTVQGEIKLLFNPYRSYLDPNSS
jgi:DNA polymerase delta subunit 1